MPDLTITTQHGDLPAYVAVPEGTGPWPGVVVVHDITGMSTDAREQCNWLAASGYVAVCPDLFSWGRKLICVRATLASLGRRSGRPFDELEATRQWLADDSRTTGRVGVIGFCMGGGFALLLAPGDRYAASSVNYGPLPDDVETLMAGACPVVASYGAKDRWLRGSAGRLEAALEANEVPHDVEEYPGAGHGFMNRMDGMAGAVVRIIGPLVGAGYHEESAVQARSRVLDFFGRHLAVDTEA